jgi:hypothetical protein
MIYNITRDCIIKGAKHRVGEKVELDDALAKHLMSIGRVEPHHEEEKPANRAVALESSEEKPKKRGRPAKKAVEPEAE